MIVDFIGSIVAEISKNIVENIKHMLQKRVPNGKVMVNGAYLLGQLF